MKNDKMRPMTPMEYEMARNGLTRAIRSEADDLLREANHALIEENKKLKSALSEAWKIGADHRKPSFDTLNHWREIINQ